MTAKILYLMPGIDAGVEEKSRRERIAAGFTTSTSSDVTVDDCDEGPISVESVIESDMSIPGLLKKAINTRHQYDALIVGCAGDPGLHALRELLDIPVVGPLESSIAVSSMIGDKFSVVTILDSGIPKYWSILRQYGQAQRCASVRAINAKVNDMIEGRVGREQVLEAMTRQVELAIADGASSIILGCMTLAFLLIDEEIKLEAPIINPAKVAIKTAEMMAALGLRHSTLTYPKPDLHKLGLTILPELLS